MFNSFTLLWPLYEMKIDGVESIFIRQILFIMQIARAQLNIIMRCRK